ncbi:hypothetical protein DMH27_20290 [Raoultella planticola]|nr:hypothetical protein [Raoultella planticola]
MAAQRVVMVVDMQNGVFATPRIERERCVAHINRLIRAADRVILFSMPRMAVWKRGAKALRCWRSWNPADALYVTKTACDAFYKTCLEQVLSEQQIHQFVICGRATDYCVDTTIKMVPAAAMPSPWLRMRTPRRTVRLRRPQR